MPRSSNSRLVGTIKQSSTTPHIREYREEAAASPRLSDDTKLAVKRHREDRADASMASCASHDDSNHPPSEVLGNFEVSDFSKNFVVVRILPKLRHTQKVVLYGKIEKSNFSRILRSSRNLTFCNDVTILGMQRTSRKSCARASNHGWRRSKAAQRLRRRQTSSQSKGKK